MKVVIAIDSFKGSVSSREAGEAAARGVRAAAHDADVRVFSLADGGAQPGEIRLHHYFA